MSSRLRSRLLWLAVVIAGVSATALAATELIAKPSVPAEGRGVQANVSDHSGAGPVLYTLDSLPMETVTPLVSRQYLNGAQSTFVRWTVKKGAVFPLHHHAAEQITWITKGRCEVYSNGRKFVMEAGDVMIIPPNTPHEFICTQDTIDIDIFSPQRQDWIDGTATYLKDGGKNSQ